MPELPEVETTLRGVAPHIQGQLIQQIIVRNHRLRWPVPDDIKNKLVDKRIKQLQRRAKYLLFSLEDGTAILHLGMSGRLRIFTNDTLPQKHDHIDIIFANGKTLRFTDPRRFGTFLWTEQPPNLHPLLNKLGLEPFDRQFSGHYLWERAKNSKVSIKSFIMNNNVVVGVGNIYAAEALFGAGINPHTIAANISISRFNQLASTIQIILKQAIKRGGTTLKDFVNSEGKPGYFANCLKVYNRAGLPCPNCHTILIAARIGQRGTVYCAKCQQV